MTDIWSRGQHGNVEHHGIPFNEGITYRQATFHCPRIPPGRYCATTVRVDDILLGIVLARLDHHELAEEPTDLLLAALAGDDALAHDWRWTIIFFGGGGALDGGRDSFSARAYRPH